jgi:hypothetical protein
MLRSFELTDDKYVEKSVRLCIDVCKGIELHLTLDLGTG